DASKTTPIKDDSGREVTANFTRDDLAAATHVYFKDNVLKIPNGDGDQVDTYYLDQNNHYDNKTGVLTVTNKWVRQVKIESLEEDRKNTRLNSSHVSNSYAVFCLRKKTRQY